MNAEHTKTTRRRPSYKVISWVAGYWADQMRSGNAPDLPEAISIEDFEKSSVEIAQSLDPTSW